MQVTSAPVFESDPAFIHLDVVHQTDADKIEETLTQPSFPWHWNKVTAKTDPDFPKNLPIKDTGQMVKPLMENADDFETGVVKIIVDSLKKHAGLDIIGVERAKANCIFPSPGTEPKHFHMPHTDKDIPWNEKCFHISCVYYVNDSDGDTLFFNKKYGQDLSDMHVIDQMTPRKGRCVIFNSNHYHTSSSPINSEKRIVLNLVMKVRSQ